MFDAWQCPTLAWGDPTLPSALRRFTSEFGMGSGGSTALWPPGKFCFNQPATRYFCAASQSNLGTFAENLEYSYHPDTHPFGAADYGVQNRSRRFCLKSPKHLWCCKVKPHGSLVLVSSMHRCTYTPSLSTSSSLTFLQGA